MTPVRKNTLSKAQRLSGKKQIALLFKAGQSFLISPIQVVYLAETNDTSPGVVAGFSAAKRKMPLAVQRNRMKRLLREAYRSNNSTLQSITEQKKIHLSVLFIYTGNNLTTFNDIENKIRLVLKRLHAIFNSDK